MERGQYPALGTGRIRPLADSKQATNEKPRPEWRSERGGRVGVDASIAFSISVVFADEIMRIVDIA
jgi:hypothetical protein